MTDIDRPPVNRGLLIALGAMAVLALLWFVLLGPMLTGDDEEDFTLPPRPDRTPEAPLPGDPDAELYPETTEVFAARDPFAQLVNPAPAGGGVGGGDGTASPGTPGGGGTPTAGPTASPGTGNGTGTGDGNGDGDGDGDRPRNGSEAEVGGTRVKLVDVYDKDGEPRALVTVNGRSYDVGEGDSFGDRFRLLDLSGECGTFLFGDSRFVLCEGDEIRK